MANIYGKHKCFFFIYPGSSDPDLYSLSSINLMNHHPKVTSVALNKKKLKRCCPRIINQWTPLGHKS